jgi:MFS family permease
MQLNIKRLYALYGLHGLIFFYSFDKVFLQLKGFSIQQVVVVELLYVLTIVLLEVPSGALSDRWSRKYVLSLSGLFFALYILLFATSTSYQGFLLGSGLAGVGLVLLSGTNTSMLFDTLKELKKEQEYEKYLGRCRAIGATVFMGAASIGGIIGLKYGYSVAFWASLPSMIMAIVVPLTMIEPYFHRSTGEVRYWQHVKMTGSFLVQRPKFIHMAVLITAVMVPMSMFDEYAQVYYSYLGIGALGLGFLGTAGSGFDGLFNTVVSWFKRFRQDYLYGVMLLLFSAGLFFTQFLQNFLGIALLIISTSAFYVIEVLAMADINRALPSKIRATSESFFSLANKLVHVPVALLFGYISQKYSPATGFGLLGIMLFFYTAYYWLHIMHSRFVKMSN